MTTSLRKLQEGAFKTLKELVQSFEERWKEDLLSRSKEPEFGDGTEALISFGETAFNEIYEFLKKEGAWVPFDKLLQEAARHFLGAYTMQDDVMALRAKDDLYKAQLQFQQHLQDRYWNI